MWLVKPPCRVQRYATVNCKGQKKQRNTSKQTREIKCTTHKGIRSQSSETLGQMCQVSQISQRAGIVLLRRLIDEYAPNGQTWVGGYRRPRRISFDIPADKGNISLRIRSMDISQETHIGVRGEVRNLASIICIWQGFWSWSVAGVDYNRKIDIGVGRDPGGALVMVDPRLWFLQYFAVFCSFVVLHSAWLTLKWHVGPCSVCGGSRTAWAPWE